MTKISQLSDIGAGLAAGDEFVIRDVSDATTPNKKVTASGFMDYVISQSTSGNFSTISAGTGPLSRVQTTFSGATGTITFGTASAGSLFERLRIDSSGRLLVGTSTARANFTKVQIEDTGSSASASITANTTNTAQAPRFVLARSNGTSVGSTTIVENNNLLGSYDFRGADGTNFVVGAEIAAYVDGTPGTNDMPTRLVLSTTADGASSPTERMRITSAGRVWINTTSALGGLDAYLVLDTGGTRGIVQQVTSNTRLQEYLVGGSTVGFISTNGSTTTYGTTSDYRLKENVIAVTDGITRLQQLKPSRFNFKTEPSKTVDGFLAHEVQAVVPEAITGEKDEIDADGNPIYQGIDQSKLVPLLTAALQEAVAKIESLEARLTAAGI